MLKIDDAERVRLITFARPEARNAFDSALYSAVADALDEAEARDDLAVVVLTGEGTAYSAGQDLAEMGRLSTPGADDARQDEAVAEHGFRRFVGALEAFPKPIVAAVNGVAVGIGTTMLPYCDLVLASTDARFRLPFAPLGVVPEAGSTFTLPTVMGWQAAAHAFFTGEWFGADHAVACGLAWRACAPEELVEEALEVARAIARMPTVSLVETKRLLLATRLDFARAARTREEAVFADLTGAPANREAIAAFLEKRDPDFTNLPSE
ncbi:MAG: enoyl-CoA hydratase-related protein [Acidimicrobiia bacterium]